jgi:hypothetical protein
VQKQLAGVGRMYRSGSSSSSMVLILLLLELAGTCLAAASCSQQDMLQALLLAVGQAAVLLNLRLLLLLLLLLSQRRGSESPQPCQLCAAGWTGLLCCLLALLRRALQVRQQPDIIHSQDFAVCFQYGLLKEQMPVHNAASKLISTHNLFSMVLCRVRGELLQVLRHVCRTVPWLMHEICRFFLCRRCV